MSNEGGSQHAASIGSAQLAALHLEAERGPSAPTSATRRRDASSSKPSRRPPAP
ncbi:MAG: hypothetical protein ACLQNG_14825 [Acidimicrobiales bacterium]